MNDGESAIQNPLTTLQRRQRALWLMGVPIASACGWWALRPLPPAPSLAIDSLQPDSAVVSVPTPEAQRPATDPATFAVTLWSPPPQEVAAPQAQPPPPPAPPPLNVQLIGIITEVREGQTIQKAALYDSDRDRLLIVADGERVRDQTLRVLAGGVVELSDGQTTRRLVLRPDVPGAAKGPGGGAR